MNGQMFNGVLWLNNFDATMTAKNGTFMDLNGQMIGQHGQLMVK